MVNNAGAGLFAPMVEVPIDRFKGLFEVNVVGPLLVTQEVAPYMIKRVRTLKCQSITSGQETIFVKHRVCNTMLHGHE